MPDSTIKTFPLTVTEKWLDEIENYREKHESKHSFILAAVKNEIEKRKRGFSILKEDVKND